jgi:two-component system, OmpR family, sensor histidine kinase KdpD
MNTRPNMRPVLLWLAVALAAVATNIILVWLGAGATTAAMIFLVLVVWIATKTGIWTSLFIALYCALSFDYFFLPPVRTMRLAGPQEIVALAAFLASCLLVGRVANLARRQTQQAEQRREDVERLLDLSQEMMLHEDAAGLVGDLPRLIERIFALNGVVLYVRDHDQFYSSVSDMPQSIQARLRAIALGQNPTLIVPGEYTVKALMLGLRTVGSLGWWPARLSREISNAVSAQVAIALTRATAMEASARLEAAREGERLRAALIDSLTHELRTPLTSIRAAATTLMQGEGLDAASRLDMASIVDEEASRLSALIGEAVEMAEIDANVVQVHLVPQHPRELLDQAIEESRKALANHRVQILVEASENPETADNPAWFDPHLLGRVLRHLLENAARYSPAGSRITLRSRRRMGRLEFNVDDSGSGIDPADLPLIFEKFYRGKKSSHSGKGTGMGLAIARAIVSAHGGTIEVVSPPGQGASFRFWVPLIEKEPGHGN